MSDTSSQVTGLTACSLCAGETLGDADPAPGGQLGRLRAMDEAGEVRLTLVECLDECERGDVLVVRPCLEAGGRVPPAWFAGLAGEGATAALRSWIGSGGPGRSPLPPGLEPLRIERTAPEAD